MQRYGVTASGLVVALIGFVLTRFTVTMAATDTTVGFLFAGMVPLVLGLGLSAAGVLLAVGAYDTLIVRRVAGWCLVGTAVMGLLVVLTLLGTADSPASMDAVREQAYLSTFLIGGAVGGALTGLYEGRNRRYSRNLGEQANRLVVLNRLLRDRVVNSATAIRAHQEILERKYNQDSVTVIGSKAEDIVATVDQVKHLSETTGEQDGSVDLVRRVQKELSAVRESYPDAEFTLDAPESATVQATEQIDEAIGHLLENTAVHSDSDRPQVEVEVDTAHRYATLRISDNGPGLPESQQTLLERGEISEYDDPTTGFGLNVVRILTERFDGRLTTDVDETGTTVELELARALDPGDEDSHRMATAGQAVPPSRGAVAVGAAMLAGFTMAGMMAALDGDLLAIGKLYGIESALVSLVTHEFHSIVFGLVYAGVIEHLPVAGRWRQLAFGIGFGLSLWLFAAGLVMPLWLDLVGIGASFPNLTVPSLAGHITWGATTSLCYYAGDRWLAGSVFAADTTILP